MADFIFIRKTRNLASSAVHILLNIVFALGSILLTVFTNSPLFGLLLVLISKWRVFAVRPRYLWLNIKASLVDFIICSSIVLLTFYYGTNSIMIDILLSLFFCVWLIIIKPKTSEKACQAQSLIAVFLGSTAAATLTAGLDSIVLVLLEFVIGYSACRHVLMQSDTKDYAIATLTGGLVFAEIAWLCNSWMIFCVYNLSGIKIPEMAIILTIFAYVFNKARLAAAENEGELNIKDILAPTIFGIIVVSVILIWFSDPMFNI